ncbi:hypothetical protein ARC20_11120 [Stenotrophomonas panacihumi]|uniref:Uncharacterized protein n=1 Tax=Stenotrophomonas panacihumi TaxID=676599 RepID=A0A0R0AAD0_9GAMM|nr:hypothetical protein ARC20_11120 [Stenotrophomonas panacihumi]
MRGTKIKSGTPRFFPLPSPAELRFHSTLVSGTLSMREMLDGAAFRSDDVMLGGARGEGLGGGVWRQDVASRAQDHGWSLLASPAKAFPPGAVQ